MPAQLFEPDFCLGDVLYFIMHQGLGVHLQF